MAIPTFNFDTSRGETPQTVAMQRALAAQIMGNIGQRQARNVGEGWGNAFAAIGQGLAARAYNDQADQAQAAGLQGASDAYTKAIAGSIMGGTPLSLPTQAPSAPPPSAPGAVSSSPLPPPGTTTSDTPQLQGGNVPALADARARYAQELQDPAVAARFAGIIQAEVGGQGPQAQQAFAETLFNRAAARGQTLAQTMQGSYYPDITYTRANSYAADPQVSARYAPVITAALGGSNVGQFATGNASGTVGFNGGPQVSAFGGERFGIEGPDAAWVQRMRGGVGTQVASADPGFVPAQPGAGPAAAPPQPAPRPTQAPPAQVAQAQGAPPAPQQPPAMGGGMNIQQLAELAGNPWLNEGQRAVINGMLQQAMQRQQQASDPMRQLQIQKLQQDLTGGASTSDIREYEYARRQGFQGSFQDYQLKLKEAGRPSTSVTIDQKAQGELEKTLAGGVGKTFTSMYDEGAAAGLDLYQIDRLRGLLAKSGSGLGPALTNVAAGFGIKLGDGADAGQAADAIISYLTPRMRIPGSGSSSDKDLAAFRRSLPSLMNTPEGNNLILDTMQGLAEYKRAQGDIAGQVVMGEVQPQDAVKMIRALPDPFAQFKAASQQQPGQSSDGWTTLPNGTRIRQKGP